MNPKRWITGPDPTIHHMYVNYGWIRTSARLRGETWDLPFETFKEMWLPLWHQRGREATSLCMARKDMEGPWTRDNLEIITRREHGRRIREHYK